MKREPDYVKSLAYQLGISTTEARQRLERGAGSVATTCFAAAQRGQTRLAEDLPQDRRVSPGEAKAAFVSEAQDLLRALAAEVAKADEGKAPGAVMGGHSLKGRAFAILMAVEALNQMLPEPDSKIAKQASGRRNA